MRHKPASVGNHEQNRPSSPIAGKAPQAPSAAALHFKIDHITIAGYSAGEEKRFTESLQFQLAQLGHGMRGQKWSATQTVALDRLDAGQLPPGATPETAAQQIAMRIIAGLMKTLPEAGVAPQPAEEDHA